jgi:three-Cys-motif partner protein
MWRDLAASLGMTPEEFDRIGSWSEVKLEILKAYASAYTQALKNQDFQTRYIDGFSGAGLAQSKSSDQWVETSPLIAMRVEPAFEELHFVDMNPKKLGYLEEISKNDSRVHVHRGDCNVVVPGLVKKHVRYNKMERALCILDPYDLNLHWETVSSVARTRAADFVINFMIVAANRGVLWRHREASEHAKEAMTRFWGDTSWEEAAYQEERGLFGPIRTKRGNLAIVEAYSRRLLALTPGLKIGTPFPVKTEGNSDIYYLIFGSMKGLGVKIWNEIARKRLRGE